MQINQSKKPAQQPSKPILASQYRAIGPAAVSAALVCAPRLSKPKSAGSK